MKWQRCTVAVALVVLFCGGSALFADPWPAYTPDRPAISYVAVASSLRGGTSIFDYEVAVQGAPASSYHVKAFAVYPLGLTANWPNASLDYSIAKPLGWKENGGWEHNVFGADAAFGWNTGNPVWGIYDGSSKGFAAEYPGGTDLGALDQNQFLVHIDPGTGANTFWARPLPTPEPCSLLLFGMAGGALLAFRRRGYGTVHRSG